MFNPLQGILTHLFWNSSLVSSLSRESFVMEPHALSRPSARASKNATPSTAILNFLTDIFSSASSASAHSDRESCDSNDEILPTSCFSTTQDGRVVLQVLKLRYPHSKLCILVTYVLSLLALKV
jgi:hypothetical protein